MEGLKKLFNLFSSNSDGDKNSSETQNNPGVSILDDKKALKELNRILKNAFASESLQLQIEPEGFRYVNKHKNINILISAEAIANPYKFQLIYRKFYNSKNDLQFSIWLWYENEYYTLPFSDNVLSGATQIIFDRLKRIVIDIRKNSDVYRKFHDEFSKVLKSNRIYASLSHFKINGELEMVDDIYFSIPIVANLVEYDEYDKRLKVIWKLADKWSFYDYDYDSIKYYKMEGEIHEKQHISGGEIKGGGFSLGKAAIGYAVAGSVGAVIAGREKITQTPITRRTEEIDKRSVVLFVEDKDLGAEEIKLQPNTYEILKSEIPEKDYEYVKVFGSSSTRVAGTNRDTKVSGQDIPVKVETPAERPYVIDDADISNIKYGWSKNASIKENEQGFENNKILEKHRLCNLINEILQEENIPAEDGQAYGFTKYTMVAKPGKLDIQVKLISPKEGVERFGYMRYTDGGEDDTATGEENLSEEAKTKLQIVRQLHGLLKDRLSGYTFVEEGAGFGFTKNTLVARLDHCDVQIKFISPKAGLWTYSKI